jgi:hypothetical protein
MSWTYTIIFLSVKYFYFTAYEADLCMSICVFVVVCTWKALIGLDDRNDPKVFSLLVQTKSFLSAAFYYDVCYCR